MRIAYIAKELARFPEVCDRSLVFLTKDVPENGHADEDYMGSATIQQIW